MGIAEEITKENEEKLENKNDEQNNNKASDYDSDKIKVLEGLEGVRLRPSMYIGDISITGFHHLAYEIIDNSVDEAMAGFCNTIKIEFQPGNRIIIEDNGRGIPTKIHPVKKVPTLELIITSLHSGGKFDKNAYKVSGGLHGVGLAVVNALSEIVKVTIWRDGIEYYQEFSRGLKLTELEQIPLKENPEKTGTRIEFIPDKTIFQSLDFSKELFERERIESRVQNMAFLNPGIRIKIFDYRDISQIKKDNIKDVEEEKNIDEMDSIENQDLIPQTDELNNNEPLSFTAGVHEKKQRESMYSREFYSGNGLSDFIQYLNVGKTPLQPPKIISFRNKEKIEKFREEMKNNPPKADEKVKSPTEIAVAFQYCENFYQENLFSFVNNIATEHGGTHLAGFKRAITRAVNNYKKKRDPKAKDDSYKGPDVWEGLTAVVSVKVAEPQFEGQTKSKLGNQEILSEVYDFVLDELEQFFDKNPQIADSILKRVELALKGRQASEKAKEAVRRKSPLERMRLPGKLADCSSNKPEECELFIVEGDSAGGSAKEGRDRNTQAILPLRGKVLNVEKAAIHKMLDNKEIQALITAIGIGISTRTSTDDDDSESEIENQATPDANTQNNGINSDTKENNNYDTIQKKKTQRKSEDKDKLQMNKLRYHKIIILTDADVDGEHIKTLLLTLFFRYMRDLIVNGHVYVAVPPIYKFSYKKHEEYYYEESALQKQMSEFCKKYNIDDPKSVSVQRYKGLGEMNPEQLAETTMNSKTRRLRRIKIEDLISDDIIFSKLMGTEVGPRRDYIMEHYNEVQNLDI